MQTILTTASQTTLGTYSYDAAAGTGTCALSPQPPLITDIMSAGLLTLHLTPVTPDIGMPFRSYNFSDPLQQPALVLTATPILRGDLNCDQSVNELDIAAFTLAMLDPVAYAAAYPSCNVHRADMDSNGVQDGRDIAGFVSALLAG